MANDLVPVEPEPQEFPQDALNDAVVEAVDDFLISIEDHIDEMIAHMPEDAVTTFNTVLNATARARGVEVPEKE